jgi:hypothetical protein
MALINGKIALVPERECGACNACCQHLVIVEEAMTKPQGLLCPHWKADCGCTIYEARPGLCREYHCGWRCLADLDEEWRPDRSGILINFGTTQGEAGDGIAAHLIVVGGETVARSRHLAGLAASFVDGGTTTHLVVPGHSGTTGHQIVLNGLIADAVAAKSPQRAQEIIGDLCDALPKQPQTSVDPKSVAATALPHRTQTRVRVSYS